MIQSDSDVDSVRLIQDEVMYRRSILQSECIAKELNGVGDCLTRGGMTHFSVWFCGSDNTMPLLVFLSPVQLLLSNLLEHSVAFCVIFNTGSQKIPDHAKSLYGGR